MRSRRGCAHSASRCARAHQIGVRSWDELPRFCSSGRGCRGRESGLGTQLGVPTTLRVCTLGCLWCAHSVLAVFGTLAWTFAFRLSSLSDASRLPDQGGLAVAVGDNTRRLVFYPPDELAALLAEFSGRFGISRSVLVRRAVRQGLVATVADLSAGREAPSSDVPDDLPVSPGAGRRARHRAGVAPASVHCRWPAAGPRALPSGLQGRSGREWDVP